MKKAWSPQIQGAYLPITTFAQITKTHMCVKCTMEWTKCMLYVFISLYTLIHEKGIPHICVCVRIWVHYVYAYSYAYVYVYCPIYV